MDTFYESSKEYMYCTEKRQTIFVDILKNASWDKFSRRKYREKKK